MGCIVKETLDAGDGRGVARKGLIGVCPVTRGFAIASHPRYGMSPYRAGWYGVQLRGVRLSLHTLAMGCRLVRLKAVSLTLYIDAGDLGLDIKR
ncbi:MAG: hypothetical protein CVU50_10310 [Candidatus Cloacimonetes bacterium HGW-Cloacimonetes-3]|nr:MAG: hypothetical protein CVU50_10310 [Candidatus Cloacimonetes bacterium HGW-Cloacimonetes-3]